jgi:DMSO/TMAO reductase YedYZ molybdopterin-dependent catalytic subunit
MNEHDWSPPHAHDPNPTPPSADPTFVLFAAGREARLSPEDLSALPQQAIANCYIVSTGHGTSGPFTFDGVALAELLDRYDAGWKAADVISADGFRTRITSDEARAPARSILLALIIDGRPLRREEGLVRLIVPGEIDDALRQVKWVSEIRVIR